MIESLSGRIFIAPEGFAAELKRELGAVTAEHDRILSAEMPGLFPAWAQDVWFEPHRLRFESISQAAKLLRGLGKFWSPFSVSHHRRAALIQEQLPKFKLPELCFGSAETLPSIGGWTLIDANTILASPTRWKSRPHGEMPFVEDKRTPPNRAYLKLWEALTLLGELPMAGERCLDLGASPGGWTWVLQGCGADVIAVDKADLDPRIARLQRVTTLKQSAFALEPKTCGAVDWLCSDVICYPERLYAYVSRWLDAGLCRRFVCTIKLQGDTDFAVIEKFKGISGSLTTHLFHNKHELTWLWPAPLSKLLANN